MTGPRLVTVTLLALLSAANGADAAIPQAEREALLALHQSTGGELWLDRDGWSGTAGSECSWFGVTCDPGGQTVVALALSRNHLSGTLPEELGGLSGLLELDLSGNRLTGTIPSSIGDLDALTSLDLHDNELTLPLPDALSVLQAIEVLDLSGNRLRGAFPSSLGELGNLRRLDLSYNALLGEVPATIRSLTNLEDGGLDLGYNALLSSDPDVTAFLEQKQGGDWSETQTVAPAEFFVESWTPISFRDGPGHYRITLRDQSAAPNDPPAHVFSTGSKRASSYDIQIFDAVGRYFATIQAVSTPHGRQKNTVVSLSSEPAEFIQFGFAPDFPFFTVGVRPEPLIQIGGVPQNSTFFTVVNFGGLGGEAFLAQTGDFFTLDETAFFVEGFSTRRVEVSSVSQPPGEYEGEVELTGDGTFEPIPIPISLISLPEPPDPDGRPERQRLDLVSGRSPLRSTAEFRNDGSEELSGIVVSDVPWIVPVTETISIGAGETALIEFDIDPGLRPDSFSERGVSLSGALRLEYADEAEVSAKKAEPESSHTTQVSTTLATVVNTVPPAVEDGALTPPGEGEGFFLIPGLRHGIGVFTDLAITNAFGSVTIGDLRALFTRPGENTAGIATFNELRRRSAVQLSTPGPSIFQADVPTASMQVRSADAHSALVAARLVRSVEGDGMFGTALPVFRSGRFTEQGETAYLTGLDAAARADLMIQSGSDGGARVEVDLLDRAGSVLDTLGPIEIDGWDLAELEGFAPTGVTTAVLRHASGASGPFAVYALLHDRDEVDPWVVVDWSSYWGESRSTPLLVPVVRSAGASCETRTRPIRREGADRTAVRLTMFNPESTAAAVLLAFDGDGERSERVVRIEPRETRVVDDVVVEMVGCGAESSGHLWVTPLRGMVATHARLASRVDGRRTGSTVPLHPRGAGIRIGERRSVAAVDDNRSATITRAIPSTWQSKFRLIETSGQSASVRATIRVSTGQALAVATVSRVFELEAGESILLDSIVRAVMGEERDVGVEDLHDLLVDFDHVGGEGSVLIVTETVENATGDTMIRFD